MTVKVKTNPPIKLDEHNDQQLVEYALLRSNYSSAAFAHLFHRYQNKIAAFVAAQVFYDRDAVDDIVQETFLSSWNKLEQLKDTAKFFSWTVSISRNLTMDYLRNKRKNAQLLDWLTQQENEEIEAPADTSELENMLLLLDEDEREVAVMRAILELSFDEIAQQLSITLSAAKMRYYRAIKKLGGLEQTHR
ncbi:RNA polymerase sigma factor [Teredinibacter haidensis]|uniref:RNA polymerase sigma factor n=1 Tax=Teredinibacter haidensis TaxID=2731755 RepID=UPI000948CDE3|nr:sigma-70 family RNA polymerase sigma factor [Teredinibacter haidensis]